MQPIATDTSDFEDLRKRGQTYVDKTAYFHRLITDPNRKFYFVFITGVSRFTKLSIFSTLSSLNDISFEDEYAAMFGYTEDELGANFEKLLRAHAEKMGLSYEDYRIGMYTLGVPDEEVRQDLALLMTGVGANEDMAWAQALGNQLLLGEFDPFFRGLKALYAGMAYGSLEERAHETSCARCLSFLLAAHGFRFRMEDVQADGRADVVAEHSCGVFIFELKVDEPAAAALEQVRAKGYDAPYRGKGQPIYLVGLSFDSKTRRLADTAVS